ncbi:MAG: efflux RND transporter periplasmic adaptor subunit [Flavobacteriales bacterium]|nr:efflux RND transporter periplasmic adaptor subunit [Flavobacteriales bacterium]
MKLNKKQITIYIILLLAGGLLGYIISKSANRNTDSSAHHTVESSKNKTWTCSMHPHIRQNKPGQCPICGMELIPLSKYNDDAVNPDGIRMSPTAMQLANVQTSVITKSKPLKEIRINGKIKPDERNLISQTSHIPGRIEKLTVSVTGETIQKGQVLAYVYSPELFTAREELLEARKMKSANPGMYQAAIEKLRNWKLSEKQIGQILESGVSLDPFPVLADVSGIVLSKKVNLGDYIRKGQTLFEIADLSNVWVLFDIYEKDLSWVKTGNNVRFTIQSIPGETFIGKITFIDPVINPKTRVSSARVEISNPGMRLKPDMFVSGIMESPVQNEKEAMVVPKSAVMWTGERSVVYIKSTDSKGVYFTMREVELGPVLEDGYMVKAGLEQGDEIATNGAFSIDAAAQLAGKPSMMDPEGSTSVSGHHQTKTKNTDKTIIRPESNAISISSGVKNELKPLFTDYFKLKDALVNDDLEKAVSASKEMSSAISKMNLKVFKNEALTVWMKHSRILQKELLKANNAIDIAQMRLVFKNISDQMIFLTKKFGAIDSPIFIDYCPMAINDKGAEWLSTKKEILNPYFGSSMLKCGEVRQTIK